MDFQFPDLPKITFYFLTIIVDDNNSKPGINRLLCYSKPMHYNDLFILYCIVNTTK